MPRRTRIAAPLGVVALAAALLLLAPAAGAGAASGVELVQRLGSAAGDDWEPAIAADRFDHVYVLWKHYDPPGFTAAGCGDPSGCDRARGTSTSRGSAGRDRRGGVRSPRRRARTARGAGVTLAASPGVRTAQGPELHWRHRPGLGGPPRGRWLVLEPAVRPPS